MENKENLDILENQEENKSQGDGKKILIGAIVCTVPIIAIGAYFLLRDKVDTRLGWQMDQTHHWHVTEKGRKLDVEEHSINFMNTCHVCNAEVYEMEEGTQVVKTNEKGDLVRLLEVDNSGNILNNYNVIYDYNEGGYPETIETRYLDEKHNVNQIGVDEYEYNENNLMLNKKMYTDGKLMFENGYDIATVDGKEYSYLSEQKTYNDDKSALAVTYDENGEVLKKISTLSDGTIEYEYDIEKEYGDNEELLVTKYLQDGVVVEEVRCEYDENGNIVSEKTFLNGKLASEVVFAGEPTNRYRSELITYDGDGAKTVHKYDENGNIIK